MLLTFALGFAYYTIKYGLEKTGLLLIRNVSNKASIDVQCFSTSL